jgi:hypothetical protein
MFSFSVYGAEFGGFGDLASRAAGAMIRAIPVERV